MVESINGVGNTNANAVYKEPRKEYSGITNPDKNIKYFITPKPKMNFGQVIITKSGKKVFIPQMIGSDTHVYPLPNGDYLVSYKPVYKDAKPKYVLMTEEQLIDKYAPKGKTHKVPFLKLA